MTIGEPHKTEISGEGSANMNRYRTAFFVVLVLCATLAAALGYVGWKMYRAGIWNPALPAKATSSSAALPAESGGSSASGPESAPPAAGEPALAPLQLSAERMQSIGLRTGEVQMKSLRQEIRTVAGMRVPGFSSRTRSHHLVRLCRGESGMTEASVDATLS